MAQTLTAHNVAAMQPRARLYAVRDALTGLELRVRPDGHKSWSLRYRVNGRQRRWKIGDVRSVPLAEARKRANSLMLQVSGGVDPQLEKRKARLQAEAEGRRITVGDLAELYLTEYAMKRKRTWKADRRMLRRKVVPKWGRRGDDPAASGWSHGWRRACSDAPGCMRA